MKYAYLIIAHNNYDILNTLLLMLDNERNDIFLHIDKNSDVLYNEIISIKLKYSKLYILEDRIKVFWGDLSMVEVEFKLFRAAFDNGPYLYYHLLSGVDLPIKSQDYIHNFFDNNQGKEFISFWFDESHMKDLTRKVSRYYLFTRSLKNYDKKTHNFTSLIRNVVLLFQKMVSFSRRNDFNFKKGSQWVSITNNFCKYLLSNESIILKRMRFTLCPDEIFIQTLIWDSKFKDNIYCINNSMKGNMREIDWKRGAPYVWSKYDFDYLINSQMLFARKFDSSEKELISKIKNRYI